MSDHLVDDPQCNDQKCASSRVGYDFFVRRFPWLTAASLVFAFGCGSEPQSDPEPSPEPESRYEQVVEGKLIHPFSSRARTGFWISQTEADVILSDHQIIFVDKVSGEHDHFGTLVGSGRTWVIGDRLYVRVIHIGDSELPRNQLHSAPLSGGEFEMVYGGEDQVAWMAPDGDETYVARGRAVFRLSDIGGTPVVERGQSIFGLAAHEGVLFWGNSYYNGESSDYLMYSYDTNTDEPPTILTEMGGAPRVVDERLYWYNIARKEMMRSHLDGSEPEVIFALPEDAEHTSLEEWDLCEGYLYVSPRFQSLYRYDMSQGVGGAPDLLLRLDTPSLHGPVCDADNVYFHVSNESVYRYPHPL